MANLKKLSLVTAKKIKKIESLYNKWFETHCPEKNSGGDTEKFAEFINCFRAYGLTIADTGFKDREELILEVRNCLISLGRLVEVRDESSEKMMLESTSKKALKRLNERKEASKTIKSVLGSMNLGVIKTEKGKTISRHGSDMKGLQEKLS